MSLIDRYILRAVLTPLGVCLCIAGMLLLLEQMLRLFDFVLAEQGPVDVVWRMLANLVPHYLGLALPLGAFLGIMLAFRNLSLTSELDALNSGGVSVRRLLAPVYGLVGVLIALDFLLVSYIEPITAYRYEQIRFDVTNGAWGVKIPQGEFIDVSDDTTIRLGSVDVASRAGEDIFLERRAPDGGVTTITARTGAISTTPDASRLILKLREGRQIVFDPRQARGVSLVFEAFDVEVPLPAAAQFRSRGGAEDEATIGELFDVVLNQSPATEPLWRAYEAGLNWRIIHPLTFLIIPILAVAVGVTARRNVSNLKPVIGVAILIVYHELLEEWGQVVAREGLLSPYVSMWGVFFGFAAVSLWLYRGSIDRMRAARVKDPGDSGVIRLVTDGAQARLDIDPAKRTPS
jgi:lipopolysaccharide export system permease protein